MFFENDDRSYTMIDIYTDNRFLGYKDVYKYYDIDKLINYYYLNWYVDKLLLFKKSNNEYIIRYNDVIKMEIIPLQLKINNSYGELRTYTNNNKLMHIHNDDKKSF